MLRTSQQVTVECALNIAQAVQGDGRPGSYVTQEHLHLQLADSHARAQSAYAKVKLGEGVHSELQAEHSRMQQQSCELRTERDALVSAFNCKAEWVDTLEQSYAATKVGHLTCHGMCLQPFFMLDSMMPTLPVELIIGQTEDQC